jgi:carbamoyl-phosphate synthase large subunit
MAAGNKFQPQGTCFPLFYRNGQSNELKSRVACIIMGFKLVATRGTQKVIFEAGIPCESVLKISEGRPNIEDVMKNGEISQLRSTPPTTKHRKKMLR